MLRLFRFALATILTVAASLFVSYVSFLLGLWAGGSRYRLEQILRLGVLLPFLVGLLAALWPQKLNRNALAAGMAGAAVGLTYGYLAVRVELFKSWHSFGESVFLKVFWSLDIEIMLCAAVASACAMLLITTSRTRNALLTVALLIIVGTLIPGLIFDLVTHNQELTVAVVTAQRQGTHSPEVEERGPVRAINPSAVSSRVMQMLRNAGIDGNYQVALLYRQGHGKQVLAVIVIAGLVTEATDLPEPRGTDVIYVQEPGGWKRIPLQIRTLDRQMEILRDPDNTTCHQVVFTDANGLSTGVLVGGATQCGRS